jgi:hypothetical protein
MGKKGDFPLVLDKNPYYTFHYKTLCKLSPNAKFIVLVRDYRANILSRKKKTHNKSGNVIFNAFLCRFFLKEINKLIPKKNCLLVRYEDFVSDQVETLKTICDFLSVEFDKTLIDNGIEGDISQNIESSRTEKFIKEHFSELKNRVHTGNSEKWKIELSAEEIELCDAICAEEASKFGYFPINKEKKQKLLIIKHFIKYLKAYYNVKKETILFYLPIKMKLKRLKQKKND